MLCQDACENLTRIALCTGSRSCSQRNFDNGFPLFLPFNADLLSKNNSIKSIKDLPVQLNFNTSYKSTKNMSFLLSRMEVEDILYTQLKCPLMKYTGWYLYDRLVEKRKHGTGLQYLICMPNIPATYMISYVVYLKKD